VEVEMWERELGKAEVGRLFERVSVSLLHSRAMLLKGCVVLGDRNLSDEPM
jgi:hypothetical protein